MAETQPAAKQDHFHKLPPVPNGAHVQKRPLIGPQLSLSSKSSKFSTIYISSKTPFISAVKRVRKQLAQSLSTVPALKNASLHSRVEALKRITNTAANDAVRPPVVTVMGTGKAIERTLSLAAWFEQEGDCNVFLRTKTVKTIDDIVVQDGGEAEDESRIRNVSCLEVAITLK